MNANNNGLWAGLTAAAVFLITFLLLNLGLILAAALAVVSFAVGWFLFPTKKPEVEAAETEVKDALAEGRQKLTQIKTLGQSIAKASMKASLAQVIPVIDKILTAVAQDPKKLRSAKQFLNYYLDSTVKILKSYVDLESKNLHDAAIQASLSKVESMLATIRDAFEKQLAKLVSGEVMDLDAELSLLQQTINMEGLGKEPGDPSKKETV